MWHRKDVGWGRPLVLLHGIGMSHAVWKPVMPFLAGLRRVIAFDIAGFGRTPPLPDETPPTISNLVDGLEGSLRELGVRFPVDFAGNSLGGCMALEAARRGLAGHAVALAPIGLWEEHPAFHVQYVFRSLRLMATRCPVLVKALMQRRLTRELALAVPISVGSGRMPATDAVRTADDLGASTAFEATFEHTRAPFSGRDIDVPVTVAFGSRDWILTEGSRNRSALPAHARWVQKRGWGHVPMWIDPRGVSDLILESTR